MGAEKPRFCYLIGLFCSNRQPGLIVLQLIYDQSQELRLRR